MKLFIAILLLNTLLLSSTQAAYKCPLLNSAYNGYSDVWSLYNQINVPIDCAAKKDALVKAHKDLADAAVQFSTISGINNENQVLDYNVDITTLFQKDKAEQLTGQAISSIYAVQTIIEEAEFQTSKCGQALISASDYFLYFSDLVNRVTPYLIIFAPQAAPAIAGISLLGQLTATLLGQRIDMSDKSQRDKFVKNACLYDELDGKVKNLVQIRKGKLDEFEGKLKLAIEQAEKIKSEEPVKPEQSGDVFEYDQRLVEYKKELRSYKESLESLPGDKKFACKLLASYSMGGERFETTQSMAQDLQSLINESFEAGRFVESEQVLINVFLTNSETTPTSLDTCAESSLMWLQRAEGILTAINNELDLPSRREAERQRYENLPTYKKWAEWSAKYSDAVANVGDLKIQIESWKKLTTVGSEFEISEIHEAKRMIRFAVFGTKYKNSPASSWLEYKLRQSDLNLNDFKRLYRVAEQILSRIGSGRVEPTENQCSFLKEIMDFWEASEDHQSATASLCDIFKTTIYPQIHRKTARYCIGSKIGIFKTSDAKVDMMKEKLLKQQDNALKVRAFVSEYCH